MKIDITDKEIDAIIMGKWALIHELDRDKNKKLTDAFKKYIDGMNSVINKFKEEDVVQDKEGTQDIDEMLQKLKNHWK